MRWISLALVITFFMFGMIFLNFENVIRMIICFGLMSFSALILMGCSLIDTFKQKDKG